MEASSQVPEAILKLVEKYDYHQAAYKRGQFNETQLRREFVDPFFKTLGWDVDNTGGYSELYKEVIHEDPIRIRGSTEFIDYAFRIGGQRKFIVETKKPAVNIKDDIGPALQIRRYAWNARLPLAILTDFEEFAVYDCTKKPKPGDTASTWRIAYFTYKEYPEKWEWIASIFAQESILKGSFDRFVKGTKGKKGTTTVDEAILDDIENWRDDLAKNIAIRNLELSHEEMNVAVQRTIDRILFLRICEDRGIEEYGCLQKLLEGEGVYERLLGLFHRADTRYNSGIFHFSEEPGWEEMPDRLTPTLTIDDSVLKKIIKRLYYPESPYEFSVISPVILGQVYEQFLGKVIRLTPGHQAKVEYKPEVKKAGGVYYTPEFIVDYIVNHTVGELVKDKTPRDVAKLRVLDPACGSGSFLLGAYQFLLDWHLNWYIHNLVPVLADHSATSKEVQALLPELVPRTGKKRSGGDTSLPIYKSANGPSSGTRSDWKLTIAERKRILLNNIYGVDIDTQAVEVTKLSLLLKVLEEESEENVSRQLKLFEERALPSLHRNIKCGNSLIGTDIYADVQATLDDPEAAKRINAFDWDREFPEIMQRGGFDAVIGNPPYVFGRDWKALEIGDDVKKYMSEKYSISPYQLDMFSLFMEKAHHLTKDKGFIGQIVPNVWLNNMYSSITRSFILTFSNNLTITNLPSNVFEKPTVDTIVYTLQKSEKPGKVFKVNCLENQKSNEFYVFNTSEYLDGKTPLSTLLSFDRVQFLLEVKRKFPELKTIGKVTRGIHPYRLGGYGATAFGKGPQSQKDIQERPYHSKERKEGYRSFIYGRDLKRYGPLIEKEYIKYGNWLAEPRNPSFFEGDRIYSRKILDKKLIVTLEDKDSIADQQVYITIIKSESVSTRYVAGILGSSFMGYFIRMFYNEATDTFPQIKVGQLKSLPIPIPNFSDTADKARHDKMVALVERMLTLHKQLADVKTDHEKTLIERQIEATDRQIDTLVYELYELTKEEIGIVEGAWK